MFARPQWVAFFALGQLVLPMVAYADIPPPPGEEERRFVAEIQAAGFTCPEVSSVEPADAKGVADYARRRLVPVIVSCSDGAKFVVADPPRHPGPPLPGQEPDAEPVVTPVK